MMQSNADHEILIAIEKVEVLDGSRRKVAKSRAAVRIEDLNGILKLAPKMLASAEAAGSTPTKAEYDVLRRDVLEIFNRLREISDALTTRLTKQ